MLKKITQFLTTICVTLGTAHISFKNYLIAVEM